MRGVKPEAGAEDGLAAGELDILNLGCCGFERQRWTSGRGRVAVLEIGEEMHCRGEVLGAERDRCVCVRIEDGVQIGWILLVGD
jgi:hypothetical protein